MLRFLLRNEDMFYGPPLLGASSAANAAGKRSILSTLGLRSLRLPALMLLFPLIGG